MAASILIKWARRLAWWASVAYSLGVLALWAGIIWYAENNIFTAFCNYLPLACFFLPLAVLAPLSLVLLSWRSLALQAMCVLIGILWFSGYKLIGRVKNGNERCVKVMSYNWGQSAGTSLKPFIAANKPDLIGLEDSGKHAPDYARDPSYSAWPNVVTEGEFILLSRYPILEHSPITAVGTVKTGIEQVTVAARFVVDWKGTRIAVYLVHMPTPRDLIEWYAKGGTFLHGLFPFTEKHEFYQQHWENRVNFARQLKEDMEGEKLPFILMGDCNTPPRGRAYNTISSGLQDCHKEGGKGFGFSFPGTTHNPLALFRPWMRIDYVFADRNWRVQSFDTEEGRRSQHQAVVATLSLSD